MKHHLMVQVYGILVICKECCNFCVDNSSSSHTDNHNNNNFLVLCKGPTYVINRSFSSPQKKFSINFSKARTKFCLSLHHNGDNSYLFVNEKEMFKFKANNKYANLTTQFCLGSISIGFGATDSREIFKRKCV